MKFYFAISILFLGVFAVDLSFAGVYKREISNHSTQTCRQRLQQSNGRNLIGAYVPQCDENGNYARTQTHASTGHSWCVDPVTGTEIENTRLGPGNEIDCRTCQEVSNDTSAQNLLGSFIPQCDDDGNYERTQFHGSTGHSWCVDPVTGKEIENTRVVPGTETDCRTCQEVRDAASDLPGSFRPQCDESGNYERTQSHGSTGHSWCVDPVTGKEIENTRVGPGTEADCRTCQEVRDAASDLPGSFRPQCDESGNYERTQSHGSTGHSWCVDPVTGKEIKDTRVGRGTEIDCRTCQEVRRDASTRNLPGAFLPQCDENGNYERTQFHGSTGHSWCVDPVTGKEIEDTRVGPGTEIDCRSCQEVRRDASSSGLIGSFIPQCDQEGNYQKKQSHGSTGHSWCVHPITGTEIKTTRVGPGKSLDCRSCQEVKDETPLEFGAFRPWCDMDGNYRRKQFHTSTGDKWCVNPLTGQEIENTRVGRGETRDCDSCQKKRESLFATYVPQCDEDGNYQRKQVDDSTGDSWCVHPLSGDEIENTRVGPGEEANCNEEFDNLFFL